MSQWYFSDLILHPNLQCWPHVLQESSLTILFYESETKVVRSWKIFFLLRQIIRGPTHTKWFFSHHGEIVDFTYVEHHSPRWKSSQNYFSETWHNTAMLQGISQHRNTVKCEKWPPFPKVTPENQTLWKCPERVCLCTFQEWPISLPSNILFFNTCMQTDRETDNANGIFQLVLNAKAFPFWQAIFGVLWFIFLELANFKSCTGTNIQFI